MPSSPWCFPMCPPVHWIMMASSAEPDASDGHAGTASPSKYPRLVVPARDLGYGEVLQKLSLDGPPALATAKTAEDDGEVDAESRASADRCGGKKRRDADDRYPCLRRALSCTETPILPLGTYALEFGFDVTSLPFAGLAQNVSRMTADREANRQLTRNHRQQQLLQHVASVPAKEANHLPSVWPVVSFLREKRPNLASNEQTLSESSNDTLALRTKRNEDGENLCDREVDLTRCPPQVQEAGEQEPRKPNQRRRRSQRKENANKNSSLTEKTRLSEIEEELSPVSGGGGNANNGPVANARPVDQCHGRQTVRSSFDSTQRGDSPADERKYASVYKKDSRTWLWKSSAKKSSSSCSSSGSSSSSSDADNKLAHMWKKDNRKWLWKSSWKKDTSRSSRSGEDGS